MDFKATKTIYMQIADSICEKILADEYNTNAKIPSVREMAANKGVNPNTIMRSYMDLQSKGIIKNQRGIGYFVEDNAIDIILSERKQQFFNEEFPEFIQRLSILRLTKEEVANIVESLNSICHEKK